MKLADNLYAYVWRGNDNNCNSFIFANILNGDKHIIFDPGHVVTPYLREPAYDMLTKEIGKDGLKVEDIGLVVLTHAHPDHVESAIKFKEKSQAQIAIHKEDAGILKMFGGGGVDVYLQEGELKLDKRVQSRLEVYHVPGHSPGHIAVYWSSLKALVVGDVIFFHSTGRVDLPGGNGGQLKRSIDNLSKLDVEYLLCGHPYGHPGVIKGKQAIRENFDFLKENIFF
jgi:glyoxylase-like metal-dependent hydrolase (beta-lactamase superfamily II)